MGSPGVARQCACRRVTIPAGGAYRCQWGSPGELPTDGRSRVCIPAAVTGGLATGAGAQSAGTGIARAVPVRPFGDPGSAWSVHGASRPPERGGLRSSGRQKPLVSELAVAATQRAAVPMCAVMAGCAPPASGHGPRGHTGWLPVSALQNQTKQNKNRSRVARTCTVRPHTRRCP